MIGSLLPEVIPTVNVKNANPEYPEVGFIRGVESPCVAGNPNIVDSIVNCFVISPVRIRHPLLLPVKRNRYAPGSNRG